MHKELEIGDVVEVNVCGVYTSCLVLDIRDKHILTPGEYGLIMTFDSPTEMYIWPRVEIVGNMGWEGAEFNSLCCELLIGDRKVWCDSCHWEAFIVKEG